MALLCKTPLILHKFRAVIHEGTLDRTTDCEGTVADWTSQEIRATCRTKRHGQVVPTLDEFLQVLRSSQARSLTSSRRAGGWTANNNEKIKERRDMTFQYGVVTRTYYSAVGGPAILEGFRDSAPKIRTAWKPRLTDEFSVAAAQALSVNAVMGKGGNGRRRPKCSSSRLPVSSLGRR